MSDSTPESVTFDLACIECDCDAPKTYAAAVRDGWTDIRYLPEKERDGFYENFLGFCPDCRREQAERARQTRTTSESDETKGGDGCPT